MSYQVSKPIVAVIGPSGSGKSTSYRNLPPKETFIIDTERKGFPFNITPFAAEDNVHQVKSLQDMKPLLEKALKKDGIRFIVIDSFTSFAAMVSHVARTTQKGFDSWNLHNRILFEFFAALQNTKATVIFTAIDSSESPDESGVFSKRVIKVMGNEIKPDSYALAEFYTFIQRDPKDLKKPADYLFYTNSDGNIPAKSPMYWGLPYVITNDLMAVFDLANKNSEGSV